MPFPHRELSLSDDVQAFVNETTLVGTEVNDTTRWGDPFDEEAAERMLEWARERLRGTAA